MGGLRLTKVLLLGLVAAVFALPQQTRVQLDTNATKVGFTVGDVLHAVHGTFKLTKGDIWFDSSTGKAGGQLIVDAASGDSGSHARDSRMNKNVLQTGEYPTVTFSPDRIEGKVNPSGNSTFGLHGLFGIHGATHELTMKVASHMEGERLTPTGNFDVPYVAWGMKNPSALLLRVNETVRIQVKVVGRVGRSASD